MLKFVIGIVLVISISWVVFWREKVAFQEHIINEWLNKNSKSNYDLNYSLKTGGFPNRIDTEIDKLKILIRENGDEFTINKTLVMSLIYNSDNIILSIKPPLKLSTDKILLEITNGSLMISRFRENSPNKPSFILHGKNLIINLNEQNFLSINDLIIAIRSNVEEPYETTKEFFIIIDRLFFSDLNEKRKDQMKNINLVFESPMDLIKKLDLQKIPMLAKNLSSSKSINKGTLKVVNTNLNFENDLSYLEPMIQELFQFFQIH